MGTKVTSAEAKQLTERLQAYVADVNRDAAGFTMRSSEFARRCGIGQRRLLRWRERGKVAARQIGCEGTCTYYFRPGDIPAMRAIAKAKEDHGG